MVTLLNHYFKITLNNKSTFDFKNNKKIFFLVIFQTLCIRKITRVKALVLSIFYI